MRNLERLIWIGIAVVFLLLWFFQKGPEPEIIKVPIEIPVLVQVPGVTGQFETVYLAEAKKEKSNANQVKDFEAIETDQEKTKAFEEAIAIREYSQTFKDEVQEAVVYSKVSGKLLEQKLEYEIFPREVDTTINTTVEIPIEPKRALLAGIEMGIPIEVVSQSNLGAAPVFKGNLMFQNKKKQIFSLGFDTEGRVWAGTVIKLF